MTPSDILTGLLALAVLGLCIYLSWERFFPPGSDHDYNPWDKDGNIKK